jgi:hypothetical protein
MKAIIFTLGIFFIFFSCIKPDISEICVAGYENNDKLVIMNSQAETLSTVNLLTIGSDENFIELCEHSATLSSIPNDMLIYDNKLNIIHSGANTLTQYILKQNEIILSDELYLGSGVNPWALSINKTTEVIYITGYFTHEIIIVDFSQYKIIDRLSLKQSSDDKPYPTAISSTNTKIIAGLSYYDYSSGTFSTGELAIIDKNNLSEIIRVSLCKNPSSFVIDESQSLLHVACTGRNGGSNADDGIIQIFDLDNWEIVKSISIGGSPASLTFDKPNKIIYCGGVGAIMSYSTEDFGIIHDFANPLFIPDDPNFSFFPDIFLYMQGEKQFFLTTDYHNDQLQIMKGPNTQQTPVRLNVADGPHIMGLIAGQK